LAIRSRRNSGAGDDAVGLGLLHVIECAERQGLQRDLGVAPRQRRRHDHREIGPLLEQQRERRDPVHVGHVDVEHHDIGMAAVEIFDGLATGPQRGDDFEVWFFLDPAAD
jgi:hypothetical protein